MNKVCSVIRGKESVTEFYLLIKNLVEFLEGATKRTFKVFYHSVPDRVIDHADIWYKMEE